VRKLFPKKLNIGDTIQVVAPSRSLALISKETRIIADQRFKKLGLKLIFGKNVEEIDEFNSSSVSSRIEDLHNAFENPKIKAVMTVIGGDNCNQLLRYLNWDLIKNNPKIFCGFSDITALNNAIYAKTGLISYSGPHYCNFGEKLYFDYTLEYFKKCLFSKEPFEIKPSKNWSEDKWWKNQNMRTLIKNRGWLVINQGESSGIILGGNLCTFNLLQGTEYFPSLKDSILFIEDDELSDTETFDRNLQSLIHQPEFDFVKGIIIGRFQKASKIDNEKLIKIIKTKKELNRLPVIADVDFGHTDPKITFPVGGKVQLNAKSENLKLKILSH